MRLIENIISSVSPATALKRARARNGVLRLDAERDVLEAKRKVLGKAMAPEYGSEVTNSGYSHGAASRRRSWAKRYHSDSGSAKEDIEENRKLLRERSRDLAMNAPFASAAVNSTRTNCVGSINIEEHKRQGKKPLLEITGKNSDEISMNVYFMARYGVNPWKQLLLLRKYNLESRVYPLGIGRRRIGSYKWVITKISNDLKTFYKNGKVTEVMAGITLKEYPYKKGSSKKKKIIKSKKKKKASGKDGADSSPSKSKKKKKGYIRYVVKEGDTLWGLAKKYYGNGARYSKIFNANKKKAKGFQVISNADKLQPGWVIKIPD